VSSPPIGILREDHSDCNNKKCSNVETVQKGYGQYCPIAKGSEIFAERWTPLIIRNLHVGAHTFTEIAAGCPRISTTLLAQRLQSLELSGVIERRPNPQARGSLYYLTPAGQELVEVTLQLGTWGARWLELAPQDYDPFVVLWAWKMNVVLDRLPQDRVVIGFILRDRPKERFWLLLHKPEAELCIKHPGFDEDLIINTDSRTLTLVHMGRLDVRDAERSGTWDIAGSPVLARAVASWGGFRSAFAEVRSVRTAAGL
jgi:DNA-binding HxlR family transcriptional regulator